MKLRFYVTAHDERGITLAAYGTNHSTEGHARVAAALRYPRAKQIHVDRIHESREGDPCPRCLGGDYIPGRGFGCACGGPCVPLD